MNSLFTTVKKTMSYPGKDCLSNRAPSAPFLSFFFLKTKAAVNTSKYSELTMKNFIFLYFPPKAKLYSFRPYRLQRLQF